MTRDSDPAGYTGAGAAAGAESRPRAVGIVGLGLMGGSLARDLAAAGWRVLGDDRDPATLTAARAEGVLSDALRPEAFPSLDLLVLALPVRAAAERIRALAGEMESAPDLVITDVGSTKRSIAAAAEAAGIGRRFVGSHPMAGTHQSGWSAGGTGFFQGSGVWICPTRDSLPHAVGAVEELWRSVGGEPNRIDAASHDRLLARMSHLPQLTATALATVLARQGIPRDALGPGGRDTTRLAGSDPDMWTDIALDNSDEIAPTLEALARELAEWARVVRSGDPDVFRAGMVKARAWSTGSHAP